MMKFLRVWVWHEVLFGGIVRQPPRKPVKCNTTLERPMMAVLLTRIILGKAMSEENKSTIRLWAKERKPELAVATTYYDAAQRAIKLRED
jgi:hypothetical protein